MRKQMMFRALPVAAFVALAGCASTGESQYASGPETADKTIVVENNGWETVRVYAVRNNAEMRIGTVEALGSQRFRLKPGMITAQGYLQVLLRPIAGNDFMTQRVPVNEGNIVHLNVQDMVQMSSLAVFTHELRR